MHPTYNYQKRGNLLNGIATYRTGREKMGLEKGFEVIDQRARKLRPLTANESELDIADLLEFEAYIRKLIVRVRGPVSSGVELTSDEALDLREATDHCRVAVIHVRHAVESIGARPLQRLTNIMGPDQCTTSTKETPPGELE